MTVSVTQLLHYCTSYHRDDHIVKAYGSMGLK